MSRRKRRHAPRKNRNRPPSKQGSARWRRRRDLGQNFLRDTKTAERIVELSGVTPEDLVVEFGPGSGALTAPLVRRAGRVIAVEYDPLWADPLKSRFEGLRSSGVLEVKNADALRVSLPKSPFKVVSNAPFGITTQLLSRLLDDPRYGPTSACLLVQDEVARKHARPSPTTLKTLSWSPFYEFTAAIKVPAGMFHPRPAVDGRLLEIQRRKDFLLPPEARPAFERFARHAFEFGTPNGVGAALRRVFTRPQLKRLSKDVGFEPGDSPSSLNVFQWVEVFALYRELGR